MSDNAGGVHMVKSRAKIYIEKCHICGNDYAITKRYKRTLTCGDKSCVAKYNIKNSSYKAFHYLPKHNYEMIKAKKGRPDLDRFILHKL